MRDTFFPLSVIECKFQGDEPKRLSSGSTLSFYLTILTSQGGMTALSGESPFGNFTKWNAGLKMHG
jgi:hypothetical protein